MKGNYHRTATLTCRLISVQVSLDKGEKRENEGILCSVKSILQKGEKLNLRSDINRNYNDDYKTLITMIMLP